MERGSGSRSAALSSVPVLRELAQLQIGYLWYNLGLELSIPIHVLETLMTNFPTDAVRCSIHMFDSWLKNDKEATYAKLLKALVAINKRSVAIDICRKKSFPVEACIIEEDPPKSTPAIVSPGTLLETQSIQGAAALDTSDKVSGTTAKKEIASIISKGKNCFDAVTDVIKLIGTEGDREAAIAHLKSLHQDGMLLASDAESAKLQCESERDQLLADLEQINCERENYEKHLLKLKEEWLRTDIDLHVHEFEIEQGNHSLEQEESELREAEKRLRKAEERERKSKLIGGAVGALIGAFSGGGLEKITEGAGVGIGLGGLVSEIEGNVRKKKEEVCRCRLQVQEFRTALLASSASLAGINKEICHLKETISQCDELIETKQCRVTSMEKLISFHKKSMKFWGLFTLVSLQGASDTHQLERVVAMASDQATRIIMMDKSLTAAKPFLETWELIASLDIEQLLLLWN